MLDMQQNDCIKILTSFQGQISTWNYSLPTGEEAGEIHMAEVHVFSGSVLSGKAP